MDVDHDELFARHSEEILAFLARRTLDPQAALDLTGETFAVAWASRRRFRGGDDDAARAWLYGIARNLLRAYLRRGYAERRALARLGVEPVELSPESHVRIEELAGLAALRRAIAAELERLPARQREALVLRVVDELSFEQVAERLGITPENARARVSRALRALQSRLA
ncbi:MAG TPA: sigma-70 family RNA polymerase sigma factor, partial [Solirubrobacteraceae bacterium]